MSRLADRFVVADERGGVIDFAPSKIAARQLADRWVERHGGDLYIEDRLARHRQPNTWKLSPHGRYWFVASYRI